MSLLQNIAASVAAGRRKEAGKLTTEALEAGIAPAAIVDEALIPAMAEVGDKFRRDEIFIPEMLVASLAMKEAMKLLTPHLVEAGVEPKYTAVIGTVQGDLHDIGKNLVAVMWRGANFKVIDLGTNVPPQAFVDAIKEHRPQIVGLSALLTTTMPAMVTTVKAIRASDAPPVKIMIGGAPITSQFADEIGADAYTADAATAAEVAQSLSQA